MMHFPDHGEVLGELKIGNPYHGVWKGPASRLGQGVLHLINGNQIPYKDINAYPNPLRSDLDCTAFLTKVPGLPAVLPQTGGDVRNNIEWKDYALNSGSLAVTAGLPLTSTTSNNPDYPGSFLYIDANKAVWQICPSITALVEGSACKVRRFGLVDGASHPFVNVTVSFGGFGGLISYGNGRLGIVAKNSTGSESIWGSSPVTGLGDAYTQNDAHDKVRVNQAYVQYFFKVTVSGIGDEGAADYGISIHVDFLRDKLGSNSGTNDITSNYTQLTHGPVSTDPPSFDENGKMVDGTYQMSESTFTASFVNAHISGLLPSFNGAGTFSYLNTYSATDTATAWAMYDANDVLHWVTTRTDTNRTITGTWSSTGSLAPATAKTTYSNGFIVSSTKTQFGFDGGSYTVTNDATFHLMILVDGVVVADNTETSHEVSVNPKSPNGVQENLWSAGGSIATPPSGATYAAGHTATSNSDVLSNFQMARFGGKPYGLAFHRLAANLLGVFKYYTLNDISGELDDTNTLVQYGPITRVITPDGAFDVEPIHMTPLWRPVNLPVSVGYGVFGTYQPIDKTFVLDTVPVCYI